MGLKVPCLLAMYILACGANTMEPEPEGFTTSMEPEPDATMAPTSAPTPGPTPGPTMAPTTMAPGGSGNGTTAAPKTKTTVVAVQVKLDNFNEITDMAALTTKLTNGAKAGAGADANVVVQVQAIHVKSSMGGIPTPVDYDAIIESIASLPPATITKKHVLIDGRNHSCFTDGSGCDRRLAETDATTSNDDGRRLATTTVDVTTVVEVDPADTTTNYITIANQISAQHANATAVQAALAETANLTVTIQIVSAPTMTVAVTTTVSGTTADIDTSSLITEIATATGGNVTVTVVSVTETDPTTAASSTGNLENDNGAPLAPMMIVWAFVYAFLMK